MTNIVNNKFSSSAQYSYGIGNIMIYNNSVGTNSYPWTTGEVQLLRNYLNSLGKTNVRLMYDARNNGVSERNWCANPLIDVVLLEAAADLWLSNAGSRQQLLPWLWTNSATASKRIVFQIPTQSDPYGPTNSYMKVRRLIQ